MTYSEAILVCENIEKEFVGNKNLDAEMKLDAIEKILGMATLNAVNKFTLLKVISWMFGYFVDNRDNR